MGIHRKLTNGLIFFCFTIATLANAQTRPRIAVLEFDNISGEIRGVDRKLLGRKVAEQILVEIVNSGKFDVVERTQIEKAMTEQNFSISGAVDPTQAAQIGKISGVDFLVVGTITEANYAVETAKTSFLVKVAKQKETVLVKLTAKLMNVQTASIIAAETASGSAEQKSSSNTYRSKTKESSASTLVDKAASEAARKISKKFIPKAIEIFKPAKAKILVAAIDGTSATLNKGTNAGINKGDTMEFYREGDPITDPETGNVLKIKRTLIGRGVVQAVDSGYAEVAITESIGGEVQVKDVAEVAETPPQATE